MAHILAELEHLDLLIQARIQRARERHASDSEFQGLYISEEDVDALLAETTGRPPWSRTTSSASVSGLEAAARRARSEIERRKSASLRQGVVLRLELLAALFDLTAFDIEVILLCLAPELDLRYERLYAYLQDDVTRKRPSVDLALNLFCQTFNEQLMSRQRLAADYPLLRHELIQVFDDPAQQRPTLLGRFLKLDERIVDYLLDSDRPDQRLQAYGELLPPQKEFDELIIADEIRQPLSDLIETWGGTETSPAEAMVLYFQGAYGVGRKSTARALCARLGRGLLAVDGRYLATLAEEDFKRAVRLVMREAILQDAVPYWDGFDSLLGDDQRMRLAALMKRLQGHAGLSFVAGQETWEPADGLRGIPFVRVEFERPGYRQRLTLWARVLADLPQSEEVDLESLAGRFRFSGGQILDVAATARSLARWRNPRRPEIDNADLNSACRLQSNRSLTRLARKITSRYGWNDIVLPRRHLEQLREIHDAARFSARVYGEWGFGSKLSLGKGLNILFAGPSGTGKTMAAGIIASELDIDMYKIDLSSVVSKYIGETEKNLSRIFSEAETANAILFFDEADALFGKRSEVRDSHDRYANIETGYLLQRMEEYEGIVILATNLSKNLDEAFTRRMHFNMEFPFPTAKDRLRIWQGVWPSETPLDPRLDFDFMARRFELSGGNIKNVALAAAFMAAAEGGAIKMHHLIRATRREYEKMGRIIMESEFTEYGQHVAAQ